MLQGPAAAGQHALRSITDEGTLCGPMTYGDTTYGVPQTTWCIGTILTMSAAHTRTRPPPPPPLSSCEGTGGGDVRFRGFSCMILPQLLPNNTRQ